MTQPMMTAATRLLQRPGQGAVLLVRRATVCVQSGPDASTSQDLEGQPLTIGSGEVCELRLRDPAVSALHCRITPTRDGFLLEDLGSKNGTSLDGVRVLGAYLPDNAEIAVGDTQLRFALADDELELALSRRTRFGSLLGHSDAMRRVFAVLEKVADTPATVLVEGESGTGKELAARGLHEGSSRREEPFVCVDCSALPENLIEGELFGHAKGAFTGAAAAKAGLFEQADGGTLFLDELGELPLELQPKLLRALETRSVRRLGEGQPRAVDVRLVGAANRNLAREVEAGRFRQDLYFRLSVIRVRMPPLRERREEVPRLVAHFREQLGHDPTRGLPSSLIDLLADYRWPGNVRELRNVVERLTLVPGMSPNFYLGGDSDGDSEAGTSGAASTAPAGGAPQAMRLELPFHEGKAQVAERFERDYMRAQLEACAGNISELARRAKLSRQTCYRLLKRYGLDP
jgi:DNA-binding NtrC family response regulator